MASDPELQLRLGMRCRKLRLRSGLSLMDVVKNNEISQSHLQKIERGVLDARLSTLNKLAAAYGVSVSTLLRNV